MATTETDGKQFTSLSAFQRDLLCVIARDGPEYGLAIKRAVEEQYGVEVNHGRLYPNLNQLVTKGLVEKSERDARTNEYDLTDAGRGVVRSQFVWVDRCLEAGR